jgi:hypothetical protein
MLRIPTVVPWLSVQGIHHLGRRIPSWPSWYGDRLAQEWLAGVVRMQEEIGTGGAGCRYLYAAFLQQSARTVGWGELEPFSERLTAVGDQWRQFALQASRLARGKPSCGWEELGQMVRALADAEQAVFTDLDRVRLGSTRLLEAR